MGNNQQKSPKTSYCFIRGSFAQTAPFLATPQSDIDIVSSTDFTDKEITDLFFEKYPNVSKNTPFDIFKHDPGKNISPIIPYYYFQTPKIVNLYDNPKMQPTMISDYSFSSTLRDNNKIQFRKFIRETSQINLFNITLDRCTFFNSAGLYMKSIGKYGINEYLKAVHGLAEEPVYVGLYRVGFNINDKCKDNFASLMIDRQKKIIVGKNKEMTYDAFCKECLTFSLMERFLRSLRQQNNK